jgi:hypothetical protein
MTGATVARPDDATMAGGGATFTVTNAATREVRVRVPNLGIDVVSPRDGFPASMLSNGASFSRNWIQELQYSAFGLWGLAVQADPFRRANTAVWTYGYVTPVAAVPASGSAEYAGKALGYVVLPMGQGYIVEGSGVLSVDFLSHVIAGKLSLFSFSWDTDVADQPCNNVAITGSQLGNRLTGTTNIEAMPGAVVPFPQNATGTFVGELYGPSAQEAGAVWTLSEGGSSVTGAFLGSRP